MKIQNHSRIKTAHLLCVHYLAVYISTVSCIFLLKETRFETDQITWQIFQSGKLGTLFMFPTIATGVFLHHFTLPDQKEKENKSRQINPIRAH